MWRFGFAQTRAGWRRLLAAGIAVALGAAFVAVTIAGADVIRRAALKAAADVMGGADFTLFASDAPVSEDVIASLPAVDDAYVHDTASLAYGLGEAVVPVTLGTLPKYPYFTAPEIVEGARPTAVDEVAVSEQLANRLDISVNDRIDVYSLPWDTTNQAPRRLGLEVVVTGITGGAQPQYYGTYDSSAPPAAVERILDETGPEAMLSSEVRIASSDPETLERALLNNPEIPPFETHEDIAQYQFAAYTGMINPISALSVLFILVALVVATLVVGNTLQVLVSQRATLIGTLRSVGATRAQIRRLVTYEALATGILGGVAGTTVGNLTAWLIFVVVDRAFPSSPIAGQFALTWAGVVLPVLAGVVVTLGAALTPSSVAARTPPLTAIRKATSPRQEAITPVRFVGISLVFVGVLTSVLALVMRSNIDQFGEFDSSPLLMLAVVGLMVFGAGFLLVSPLFFPAIAGWIGALITRLSPGWTRTPVRLARTNLRANARRTTATSNALLVGVTLISMLVTGAATARASLSAVAASMLPTDIVISSMVPGRATIDPQLLGLISRVKGVEAVAPLHSGWIAIGNRSFQTSFEGMVGDPEDLQAASYSDAFNRPVPSNTLLLNPDTGFENGLQTRAALLPDDGGDPYTDYEPFVPLEVNVAVRHAGVPSYQTFLDRTTAEALGMDLTGDPDVLWIRTQPGKISSVAEKISALLPSNLQVGVGVYLVDAPGLQRQQTESAITNVVLAASGLLAISIVIALVGVVNTLSLSVFERRREIALLRAVGLTTRQLRISLAIEGLIITVAATLLGIVIGAAIGALGGSFIFSGTAGTQIRLPWLSYLLIFLGSLIAGPAASVLPATQALGSSPVEDLDAV